MEDPRDQALQQFQQYGGNTPMFSLEGQSMWGRVVDVYDGDTLTLVLPILGTFYKFNTRMYGIDTCELKSKNPENKAKAMQARQRLMNLVSYDATASLTLNTRRDIKRYFDDHVCVVWVKCLAFDKYGRLLANLYERPGAFISFADTLIKEGLGYAYEGETKLTEQEQLETLA